ncbi:MAG: putative DNA binding domain-containing protein [Veillonellaceae bacterium]|nr:putative DNA binding domain-containing protein [Veillonellaceae bacterium]
MHYIEDEQTELKQTITDNLKKEVLAFINTKGGTIYIGIADDGRLIGVENPDEMMLAIRSMIHDSLYPDAMMFIQLRLVREENKSIIKINVLEGINKPYYLLAKGLRPSGIYIRQGTATVKASSEAIRQMIKQSDGDVFEENISLEQDLTFTITKTIFKQHGLLLEKQQMQILGFVRIDGVYTNLAWLLSDQCPFSIKAAVFQGQNQEAFKDRKEFNGSLLKQLEDCYEYLELNNPVAADFQGLYRKDKRVYPSQAIREALLNYIVHRDYSINASSLISVYENRMEFTSIGGLLPGIQKDDILLGVSVCRNKGLANIFYRLGLIEAYGGVLLKIMSLYKGHTVQPQILTASNSFKIILPRMTDIEETIVESITNEDEEKRIISYITIHGKINRRHVESLLGISGPTALRILKTMIHKGYLCKQGQGKNTVYILQK